tara:strand:+ start:1678 stop:2055 length:378 start_codon:yes stop_codon:yes gene_type:complete
MKKLKKSLFYASAIGFLINPIIQKAFSFPSLFFSTSSVRRANKELCVMESYSVLAQKGFYPAQNVLRNKNAVFAMANNSDTQIIVLCGQVSNHGSITVVAAFDIPIGMSLTENIVEDIVRRLNTY